MTDEHPASPQQKLQELTADPQINRLALRWAGDPDAAKDILQQAYYVVARLSDPNRIEDLRGYFLRVLRNEASRWHSQRRAELAQDVDSLEARQDRTVPYPAPPRPLDETVNMSMLGKAWLGRLAAQREHLRAAVAGRSAHPDRYRDLIVTVAEQVIRDALSGEHSEADTNEALRDAYPEWFDGESCTPSVLHRRLSRARTDVRDLLKTVIGRDAIDLPLPHTQEDPPTSLRRPARQQDAHRLLDRPTTPSSHDLEEMFQEPAPQDEHMRTADDAVLTALFHEAEQTRLPEEMPYNLKREVQLFVAWLEGNTPDAPSEHDQNDPP